MLIALLSCLSFLPAQRFLRSETLAALFQFGWSLEPGQMSGPLHVCVFKRHELSVLARMECYEQREKVPYSSHGGHSSRIRSGLCRLLH